MSCEDRIKEKVHLARVEDALAFYVRIAHKMCNVDNATCSQLVTVLRNDGGKCGKDALNG